MNRMSEFPETTAWQSEVLERLDRIVALLAELLEVEQRA